MKRLLLIGKKLPRLESIDWASTLTHNILDYQGLLFDCREMGEFGGAAALSPMLSSYCVAGHAVFIILPDLKNATSNVYSLQFLPAPFGCRVQKAPGKTLNLVGRLQPFVNYYEVLRGHEIVFDLTSSHAIGQPGFAAPMVVDNLHRYVCASVVQPNLHFFHPPPRAREADAFRILVDFFNPDYLEPEPESPPDWAQSVVSALPGVAQIENQLADIALRIDDLENEADIQSNRKQQIEKWAQLLWLDGIPLQQRVRAGFEFLGFGAEMSDPTGHSEDIVLSWGTQHFLLEVTGAAGSIKIDKGRELMQWILDSAAPDQIRGLLVGNAFRNDPPNGRPPTVNHKFFTTELEALAARFDFALLDVRELYKAIISKLEGKEIDLDEFCRAISGKGVVVIPAQCFRPPSGPAEDSSQSTASS